MISLNLVELVAGARYRGDFEENLKTVIQEVKANNDVILFIDEVHTLIGAGAAEGAMDAANILKPALARGELQVNIIIKFSFENKICKQEYFNCFYTMIIFSVSELPHKKNTENTLRKILHLKDVFNL